MQVFLIQYKVEVLDRSLSIMLNASAKIHRKDAARPNSGDIKGVINQQK